MTRITASALDRLDACPGSHVLPHAYETSEHASRGTAIHAFLQRANELGGDREAALAEVPAEHYDACAAVDEQTLPLYGETAAEVALAYDPSSDTAREIGRGMERAAYLAALRGGEIGCIVDVVGLSPDAAYVADYKTGWRWVSPASWQLRFQALAVSRAYGRRSVTAQVVRVRDGENRAISATYDAWDLDGVAADLEQLLGRVAAVQARADDGKRPPTYPGEHCQYCPAQRWCQTRINLALALSGEDPLAELGQVRALTPQQAGQAWRLLDLIEPIVAQAREDLKLLAREVPLPLGDGQFLGIVAGHRDRLDADALYQAVRAKWGEDVAEVAAPRIESRTATKTKTVQVASRLLRDRGQFKSIVAAKQAIEALAHDTGAATRMHYDKITTYAADACATCGVGQALAGGPCRDCSLAQEVDNGR